MKEEKRKIPKLVRVVLAVITICIIYVIAHPICNSIFKRDEVTIQSDYERKKQNVKLLKEICKECIYGENTFEILSPILEEDEGYINQESISYKIYRKGENIILYYEIKEPSRSEKEYYATITLSKDFEILKEEYSTKLEDFETYKQQCKDADKITISFLSFFLSVAIFLLLESLLDVFSDVKTLINKRKK